MSIYPLTVPSRCIAGNSHQAILDCPLRLSWDPWLHGFIVYWDITSAPWRCIIYHFAANGCGFKIPLLQCRGNVDSLMRQKPTPPCQDVHEDFTTFSMKTRKVLFIHRTTDNQAFHHKSNCICNVCNRLGSTSVHPEVGFLWRVPFALMIWGRLLRCTVFRQLIQWKQLLTCNTVSLLLNRPGGTAIMVLAFGRYMAEYFFTPCEAHFWVIKLIAAAGIGEC